MFCIWIASMMCVLNECIQVQYDKKSFQTFCKFSQTTLEKYTSKCSQTNRKMNMNKCLFKNPFKYSMKGFLLPSPLPFFEKKYKCHLWLDFQLTQKWSFFKKIVNAVTMHKCFLCTRPHITTAGFCRLPRQGKAQYNTKN